MARTWFGEIPFCCSLTLLFGPARVLLEYVLQTIFSGPVYRVMPVSRYAKPRQPESGLRQIRESH